MKTSEMVTSLREMATMATVQQDSVLVKKSFLKDVANMLEDLDERVGIMLEGNGLVNCDRLIDGFIRSNTPIDSGF